MIDTMNSAKGIGLAAVQIGQSIRLAIVNKDADESLKEHLVIINPKIFSASSEIDTEEEGCLSIPGKTCLVPRHRKIKIRYTDVSGQEQKLKATGLFARVIQHEIDHLDGVLIIERTMKMIKGQTKAAIAEGLADYRAGRVAGPYKNMAEFKASRQKRKTLGSILEK